MRRILGVLAALTLALAVAGGAMLALLTVVSGGLGCPLALVEGTLVDASGTLAVESDDGDNTVVTVRWPPGYGVSDDSGTLVLTHLFSPVAREGDHVAMGGGSGDDGTFTACGPITVRPAGASPTPSGTPAPTLEVEEARAAPWRVAGTHRELGENRGAGAARRCRAGVRWLVGWSGSIQDPPTPLHRPSPEIRRGRS